MLVRGIGTSWISSGSISATWDTGTAWDGDSSRETDGPSDNGSDDGEPTRCSDDELEPNDTLETATEVDSLNYFTASGTLCDGSDVDRLLEDRPPEGQPVATALAHLAPTITDWLAHHPR